MSKRFQVFVSSTYADLRNERQSVIQALMEMDCIPAGMEIFPAADEEQWSFIKRVIDDCDYYLLIIGGRYGSTTEDGVSYTEKEYDYAVERALPIIALLHGDPDAIPVGKSDLDKALRAKLDRFKARVSEGRLVKFWTEASELPGMVALSLSKTIKSHPAIGWVRGNTSASAEVLSELNEVRKEKESLASELSELRADSRDVPEDLAGLDEIISLSGTHGVRSSHSRVLSRRSWDVAVTWREVFGYVSPYLNAHPSEAGVKTVLASAVHRKGGLAGSSVLLNDQDFKTVSVQLEALGLVNIKYSKTTQGGMGVFWSITPQGRRLMLQLRTIRTANPPSGG